MKGAAAPHMIIEIVGDGTGGFQTDLVHAAYGLSQRGVVALALRDVSRAEVDRVLDSAVRERGCQVAGVLYADATDDALVRSMAAGARIAVASTDAFRRLLLGSGVTVVSRDDAAVLFSDNFHGASAARHV